MLQIFCFITSLINHHRELLVRGFPIFAEKAPYITRIYMNKLNRTGGFCGGSLIADKFVLTAAHCIVNMTAPDIAVGTYNSFIYSHSDGDSHSDLIGVKNIWIDPRYDNENIALGNDAALLELVRSPVNYGVSNGPQAITLSDSSFWYNNSNPLDTAFVIGYGSQVYGGPQSYELRAAHVHLHTRYQCFQKMEGIVLSPSNLCASLNGADSCSGDSGGPLIVAHNSRFYHVGIVSFGLADRECGDANNPGVYSLTSFTESFIQTINPNIQYERYVALTGPDPCSCSSVETGCTSNGFNVSSRCGCANHDGDGIAYCYVQFETCSIASHSTYFFGASYRFCNVSDPNILAPNPPPISLSCNNNCLYANDGECDDGGLGSEFSECNIGTDCDDCNFRTMYPPPSPTSLLPSPMSPSPMSPPPIITYPNPTSPPPNPMSPPLPSPTSPPLSPMSLSSTSPSPMIMSPNPTSPPPSPMSPPLPSPTSPPPSPTSPSSRQLPPTSTSENNAPPPYIPPAPPLLPNQIMRSSIELKLIIEENLDTFDKKTFEQFIKRKFSNAKDIQFLYLSASVFVNVTLVYSDIQTAKIIYSDLQKSDTSSIQNDWFDGTFVVTSFSSEPIKNEITDSSNPNKIPVWQISIVIIGLLTVCLCLILYKQKNDRNIAKPSNKKIKTQNVRITVEE